MQYKIQVYSFLEDGQRRDEQGRPHQEDCIYPAPGSETPRDRTFILCDGMGGHDAGEVASATVCEAMSRSIANDGHDDRGEFSAADFDAALNAAYEALDAADSGAAKTMGTTMTFLKLHSRGAFIAHMGDSRVYHIRPGKDGESTRILFQTSDHSLVNSLVKLGEMTPEEARVSNQRNVITRAMQPRQTSRCQADCHTIADIRPGDYFYMCSDGMLEQEDMDDGTSLRNIFSHRGGSEEEKVAMLKGATVLNRDNHSAIIVHVLDVVDPLPVPAESATAEVPSALPFMPPRPDVVPGRQAPQGACRRKTSPLWWIIAAVAAVLVIAGVVMLGSTPKEKPVAPGPIPHHDSGMWQHDIEETRIQEGRMQKIKEVKEREYREERREHTVDSREGAKPATSEHRRNEVDAKTEAKAKDSEVSQKAIDVIKGNLQSTPTKNPDTTSPETTSSDSPSEI